jgi:hypothetical protein
VYRQAVEDHINTTRRAAQDSATVIVVGENELPLDQIASFLLKEQPDIVELLVPLTIKTKRFIFMNHDFPEELIVDQFKAGGRSIPLLYIAADMSPTLAAWIHASEAARSVMGFCGERSFHFYTDFNTWFFPALKNGVSCQNIVEVVKANVSSSDRHSIQLFPNEPSS